MSMKNYSKNQRQNLTATGYPGKIVKVNLLYQVMFN